MCKAFLNPIRSAGEGIGFVPTMGSLMPGTDGCSKPPAGECTCVVVGIFLNPDSIRSRRRLPMLSAPSRGRCGVLRQAPRGYGACPIRRGDVPATARRVHRSDPHNRLSLSAINSAPATFARWPPSCSSCSTWCDPVARTSAKKTAHQFAAMRRMVVDLIGKTRLIDNLWRIPPARWLKQDENIQTGVTHL
jgi:hypothetical protein